VRPGEEAAYLAVAAPNLTVDPGWLQSWEVRTSPLRFLLGTDELGRDLAVRILEGGRLSLAVGLAATLVSVTIGLLYGGIAGYAGGRVDTLLMRIVDVLYSLPFLLFVILLMVVFPRSLLLLFLAIGAVEWLTTARIVRGEILARKRLPYVLAARALGLGHGTILLRHLLPNTLGPVLVYATLTVPTVILLESVLSFLGLGVQPPASSWGILINEGAERMLAYPWMLIGPSVLFALTLLSLNLLGDGLRDRLDPRTRFRLRR
jgi:oligopeptide transport system permease protein